MVTLASERSLSSQLAVILFAVDDLDTRASTWYTVLFLLLQLYCVLAKSTNEERIEYIPLLVVRLNKIITRVCGFTADSSFEHLIPVFTKLMIQVQVFCNLSETVVKLDSDALDCLYFKLKKSKQSSEYTALRQVVSFIVLYQSPVAYLQLNSQPSTIISTFASFPDTSIIRPRKRNHREINTAVDSVKATETVVCSPKRQRCISQGDYHNHSFDVSMIPSWMERMFPCDQEPEPERESDPKRRFTDMVKLFLNCFWHPSTGSCRKCVFLPWHRLFHKQ